MKNKVYVQLLGFAIFTGGTFNASKYAVQYFSAIHIAAWRFGMSVLGYLWWNNGIAQIGAARTSLFFNLVPVVTMLISFIEGVNITVAQCIGMILVITGVLYSSGIIKIKSKESVSI
ncbi:hypothetical protein CN354_03080 [Bacillus cereus]|nr:hypothetical protein CN354_03080 [Bacillus cereus]